eukprot:NODE_1064_length_1585_cov_0.203230.p1 type:complete len:138 gc:universal NODE_1064_length_1585_cov_0.203230:1212-799(-)
MTFVSVITMPIVTVDRLYIRTTNIMSLYHIEPVLLISGEYHSYNYSVLGMEYTKTTKEPSDCMFINLSGPVGLDDIFHTYFLEEFTVTTYNVFTKNCRHFTADAVALICSNLASEKAKAVEDQLFDNIIFKGKYNLT